jgi:hypothetical protein
VDSVLVNDFPARAIVELIKRDIQQNEARLYWALAALEMVILYPESIEVGRRGAEVARECKACW